MGKVYMIRHGETDWNANDRVLGRIDLPLNENGLAQAEAAAEKLASVRADHIYSSPLVRARKTAEIIGERQGVQPEIRDCLMEQDFGSYDGGPRKDPGYEHEKYSFFIRCGGGENYLDMAARVYPFLREIKEDHAEETVMLVTHGAVSRVIVSFFRDMENEEVVAYRIGNCEYLVFDI